MNYARSNTRVIDALKGLISEAATKFKLDHRTDEKFKDTSLLISEHVEGRFGGDSGPILKLRRLALHSALGV